MPGERLDFTTLTSIRIDRPDMDTFLGLPLAIKSARCGGSMPTVFNAANEAAVAKFLNHKIGFLDIYDLIIGAMDAHKVIANPDLDQILDTEKEARAWVEEHTKE